ncbi:MAG: carboxypeptidase regulatory-like domain-containing protein [Planctomycetes bacterium]|nr:carboxypeptidase regulatory-like domain-containing protein [Planctomycetota bacterium]
METPRSFDPQLVAAQLAFVRRLAGGLVRDASAADDLAALTVAAALEQRPETGGAFRGWLRRVVIRLATRDRLAQQRRDARERLVAAPEAQLDAATAAAQIELARRVTTLLESLAEPYRTTLWQRYFADLSPAAIAERDRLPLATVKSRLQRGLALLREQLDAAHGGRRETWAALLLPWIGGPVLMSSSSKALVGSAAALLLLGGTFAWWRPWTSAAGDSAPLPPLGTAAATAGERASRDGTNDAAPLDAAALERPLPAARVADGARLPFAAGRVVEPSGRPLAGVAIVGGRIEPISDPAGFVAVSVPLCGAQDDAATPPPLARTDAEGHFRIESIEADVASLWFFAPGRAAVELHALAADAAGRAALEVVLAAAAPLRGVVVDDESRPIPFAELGVAPVVTGEGPPWIERQAAHLAGAPTYLAPASFVHLATRADASGRFALDSLPAAPRSIGASAAGYLDAAVADLGDAAGDARVAAEGGVERRVALRRCDLLVDAIDAESGAPCDDVALLLFAVRGAPPLHVAAPVEPHPWWPRGRARLGLQLGAPTGEAPLWLPESGAPLPVEVAVVAPGYRLATLAATLARDDEPPHLVVRLERDDGAGAAAVAGRVEGATDAMLELHARLPDGDAARWPDAAPLARCTTDRDGRFAFRELPAGSYSVVARAAGFAPLLQAVDAPADRVRLAFAPPASLEVAVVDAAGALQPGSVVQLQTRDGARAWRSVADRSGRARFERLPAGEYDLAAFELRSEERAFVSIGDASALSIEEAFLAADRIALAAGAQGVAEVTRLAPIEVELRVVEAEGGRPRATRFDSPRIEGAAVALIELAGFLDATFPPLDAEGVTRARLWPGRYEWQVRAAGSSRRFALEVPREHAAGSPLQATVELPPAVATRTVRGRLVDRASGAAIPFRDVRLAVRGGAEPLDLGFVMTDGAGRFTFADVPLGALSLEVRADCRGGAGRFALEDPASPYPAAQCERLAAQAGASDARSDAAGEASEGAEWVIELPPVRGAATVASTLPTVPLRLRVVDSVNGAGVAGARVTIELHEESAGERRTIVLPARFAAETGRLEGDLLAAARYRVTVAAADGTRRTTIELEPTSAGLTAEITLPPR